MAEYRALSQNTYKFVSTMETVLQYAGDIGSPNHAQISRIKRIDKGKNEVEYVPIFPAMASGVATSFSAYGYSKTGPYSSDQTETRGYAVQYSVPCAECGSVILDGQRYHGLKNCVFCVGESMASTSKTTSRYSFSEKMFPGATIKVVKYEDSSGLVKSESYDFTGCVLSAASDSTTTSMYIYGFQILRIAIPKNTNDLILAISIEYPKYDITFNNVGLQYSIDDGVTFANVTAGLVLEQVEHIVFKNTSDSTRYVGTTEGGSDVASIAAGTTYVAVPTASGTWYIS